MKIPQKLSAATSSVHHRMVHPSTVLVLSGFLCPSPFPSHSYDTHLPSKLPFKENKREDRKKKMAAMTRGQTASHYHNSGNHITVPLRLIQRSSRRTSHNLQRSNRNITLSNPPTLYMETDGNKKLIEEHPAPPSPHPQAPPHQAPHNPRKIEVCVRVTPGHQRSHKSLYKGAPNWRVSSISHLEQTPWPLGSNCSCAVEEKQMKYILQH